MKREVHKDMFEETLAYSLKIGHSNIYLVYCFITFVGYPVVLAEETCLSRSGFLAACFKPYLLFPPPPPPPNNMHFKRAWIKCEANTLIAPSCQKQDRNILFSNTFTISIVVTANNESLSSLKQMVSVRVK